MMFVRKKVRDIMIPIGKYSVVSSKGTLRDAVSSLRTSYCELESGMCSEAGPRTVLVISENNRLVGILDFRTILKVLVPEVAGSLTDKLSALGVSVAFAEADSSSLDEIRAQFHERVMKNAGVKVDKIILKVRGSIDAGANLLDALKLIFRNKITVLPVYDGGQLVGVLRDADLFLAVADVLSD